MHRQNVRSEDGALGWFDLDAAEEIGRHRSSDYTGTVLYRTRGGRWVMHHWTRWQGAPDTWVYADDAEVERWLAEHDLDDQLERFFGPVDEERGPGRPEIGAAVNVRLGDELLARVDERARADGVSRAEMLRRLVAAALG